jgi:hypothetical protein
MNSDTVQFSCVRVRETDRQTDSQPNDNQHYDKPHNNTWHNDILHIHTRMTIKN